MKNRFLEAASLSKFQSGMEHLTERVTTIKEEGGVNGIVNYWDMMHEVSPNLFKSR